MRPAKSAAREIPLREIPRQLEETIREQWPIIAALIGAAVVVVVAAEYVLPQFGVRNGDLTAFLLNLSADLCGAVVIFVSLERGIKSLNAITVIPVLPVDRFINEIRTRGKIVRVLETWTALVNDDACRYQFAEALRHALRSNATVQVFLIHPDCSAAPQRAQQLAGSVDVIQEIRKSIRRFYALDALGRGLEVRLYNALPSITMYQCNRTAYVSLFPVSAPSSQHDLLEVEMFSRFGLFIERSFDELWAGSGNSRTIPVQAHMRLTLDPSVPGPGAYFAFQPDHGLPGRMRGYLAGPRLWDYLLEDGQLRDRIAFDVDGTTRST
jgi:hypothetical protein